MTCLNIRFGYFFLFTLNSRSDLDLKFSLMGIGLWLRNALDLYLFATENQFAVSSIKLQSIIQNAKHTHPAIHKYHTHMCLINSECKCIEAKII